MLFGGKKKEIIQPQLPAQFKREKLSTEALDHFALAYPVTHPKDETFPYVLKDGKQILIGLTPLVEEDSTATKHFRYLLGQTYPYQTQMPYFYLRELLFTLDENGNKVPWTRDKKSIVQFSDLAKRLYYLIEYPMADQNPKDILYGVLPNIEPVRHVDKERPAPGEE